MPGTKFDIEFARWGNASDATNAQYVVQPYGVVNHLVRFTQPGDAVSMHRFTWQKGLVNCCFSNASVDTWHASDS